MNTASSHFILMISAMLSIGILILDVVMVMVVVARRAADKGLGHVICCQ